MKKIIIALDGYSACGKSTTAKAVSKILGFKYIDSGAMYRAVTYFFTENHISISNPHEVTKALDSFKIKFQSDNGNNNIYLNGLNVEEKIRSMDVSSQVSTVSAIKSVRMSMVKIQRSMGRTKGVIMDGRDIGTVVFPDAELKIFMTADISIRTKRRQRELLEHGELINLSEVKKNLEQRDYQDSKREHSPLQKADDAIEIDTTFLTLDEQVDMVVKMAASLMLEKEFSVHKT